MGALSEGIRVIEDAEVALRGLMRKQLDAGRYTDLAPLARLADALAGLVTEAKSEVEHPESGIQLHHARTGAARPPQGTSPRSSRTGEQPSGKQLGYPRFRIENGWITKVGWSKRNQAEYEHHAPKGTAIAFARHIDQNASPGIIWTVESLGNIGSAADDVPAYQIYLLIKWFRSLGVLTKHGRDGYTATAQTGLETVVKSAFDDA